MSRVPPELCDLIIGLFDRDEDTLSACALADRSFLPRIRYVRFRSLTVDVRRSTAFLRLRNAAELACYVRELHLFKNARQNSRQWTYKRLTDFTSAFAKSKIQVLSMTDIAVSEGLMVAVQRDLEAIKELSFDRCPFTNIRPERLYVLTCLFAELEVVTVQASSYVLCGNSLDSSSYIRADSKTLEGPRKLTTLKIPSRVEHDFLVSAFLLSMIEGEYYQNIQHLHISDVGDIISDLDMLNTLLSHVGPNLRSLAIGFKHHKIHSFVPEFIQQNSLRWCTSLREFTLLSVPLVNSSLDWDAPETDPEFSWIPQLLDGIASPELLTVNLHIDAWRVQCVEQFARLDMRAIDELLSNSPRFHSSPKVHYTVLGSSSVKDLFRSHRVQMSD